MIVQFRLYLIHKYNTSVISRLTVSAATRVTAAKWDVEKYCAHSPEDEYLKNIVLLANGLAQNPTAINCSRHLQAPQTTTNQP